MYNKKIKRTDYLSKITAEKELFLQKHRDFKKSYKDFKKNAKNS